MSALFPLTAAQLAELLDTGVVGDASARIERIVTDSRAGIRCGDAFVGLVGERFDGGAFARAALDDGASTAVISAETAPPDVRDGEALVVVHDPLTALQTLAGVARGLLNGTIVGITGSNGKTTVKEMLRRALSSTIRISASPMSYNSQVGVALSLLGADANADVVLVECGISEPGEMERLERFVRPDCGILVNVGSAHLEGLGSRETIADEKAKLFTGVATQRWVLTPSNEDLGLAALERLGAPIRRVSVTTSGNPALDGLALPTTVPDLPDHFRQAAALAMAAAHLLGTPSDDIDRGIRTWRPAPMRLELSTTPRGVMLINDAYTSDPVSAEAALGVLMRPPHEGRTVAVLGEMLQLGDHTRGEHEALGNRVEELGVDILIGVGAGGRVIVESARAAGMRAEDAHAVASVSEAGVLLDTLLRSGDRVLLKGNRPQRLEQLASALFDSIASTRLYVDLDRILTNYHRIDAAIGPDVSVMAVVKSFGYGLDSTRLAAVMERAGVAHFAVAYPDEGVRLRDKGVSTPILVQNVVGAEVDKVVRYGLSAQIVEPTQIASLSDEARRQRRVVRVHLKIDTGMGRSGVFAERAPELARAIREDEWLDLDGVMTHFASADDPSQDAFTREQIAAFDAVLGSIGSGGPLPRWIHASNSAGILRFPEARYTMVRAGIALFGYSDAPDDVGVGTEPVLRLVTRVVSVKRIPAGHTVGYGRTYATGSDMRTIAVVAIGYNDGYPWALSNRGWMLVHDRRCPVVGRVCMDVTMLDVSELDGDVSAGDEVVVFGHGDAEPSVLELAELAQTIPYELLTRLSPRVRRIFESSV